MKLLPRSGAHRRRRASARLSGVRPETGRVSVLVSRLPALSMPRRSSTKHREPGRRSVEKRRARALLVAAVAFAGIVLLTALPWSTLLNQHAALSSATTEVNQLQIENRALAVQARELSGSATMAGLARQDYGLVEPGQKAYDILPPPGTASRGAANAGHVPLDEAPVVPGSRRSEELLGASVGTTANASTAPTSSGKVQSVARPIGNGSSSTDSSGTGGFWTRVGHTLEFWN